MSKYKGTILFDSALDLRLFKTARVLGRLSLICGIISGLLLISYDHDLAEPTLADAVPTMAFLGFWLLLRIAVRLRIRKAVRASAARRGQTPRQYRKETAKKKFTTRFELSEEGKYPKTKRGQERRAKDALDRHWKVLNDRVGRVPRVRRMDRTKKELADSFRALRETQDKCQSIVDQTSREYAVREYAALNDVDEREVRGMLSAEDGRGPVTEEVDRLYRSVHYQYEAYFENHEYTLRGAFKGYSEAQGVGGSKKRVYHD